MLSCVHCRVFNHYNDVSLFCLCVSARVTPCSVWTALQGLEYGSSASQQALLKAVRRSVFKCFLPVHFHLSSSVCVFWWFYLIYFICSDAIQKKKNIMNNKVRWCVWGFKWWRFCRWLSEEAPGGCGVRRWRLHQKDERWLSGFISNRCSSSLLWKAGTQHLPQIRSPKHWFYFLFFRSVVPNRICTTERFNVRLYFYRPGGGVGGGRSL